MTDNPAVHRRRSIRLQGYDYAQAGAYFVTLCAWNREYLFGDIIDGKMVLNNAGQIAKQCWQDIPAHFPKVALDEFVIMPNHVHGILYIVGSSQEVGGEPNVGAKDFSPLPRPRGTSKTLGSIVRGFKIGVTKWMRQHTTTRNVWQRNYWEHIIRNETELDHLREYIQNNPAKWELDSLYGRGRT